MMTTIERDHYTTEALDYLQQAARTLAESYGPGHAERGQAYATIGLGFATLAAGQLESKQRRLTKDD